MKNASIISEFFGFLLQKKIYFLLPVVTVLILVGVLLVFAEGSALAPFIYTMF